MLAIREKSDWASFIMRAQCVLYNCYNTNARPLYDWREHIAWTDSSLFFASLNCEIWSFPIRRKGSFLSAYLTSTESFSPNKGFSPDDSKDKLANTLIKQSLINEDRRIHIHKQSENCEVSQFVDSQKFVPKLKIQMMRAANLVHSHESYDKMYVNVKC